MTTQRATPAGLGLLRLNRPSARAHRRRPLLAEPKAFRLGVVIGLVLLHAVLGVLCKQSRWVAVAHALGTLIFGLYLSLTSRELLRVACWGAYVVGAEVLWRMAQAPLPWEYAKYAVSLVLLISLMRNRPARVPWTPVVYFLLLLPAVIPTFVELPLQEVRNPLSFNLSGPLSVAVCALFFSQVEMDSRRIQRLMVSLILPVTSIAAAALLGLTLVENIEFGAGANFAASGGFGPNQVSAILGLGALNGFLLALNLQLKWKLRITFLILALWLAAHLPPGDRSAGRNPVLLPSLVAAWRDHYYPLPDCSSRVGSVGFPREFHRW